MRSIRKDIGGLGNLLFKEAYIYAQMRDGAVPDLYLQDEKYFAKYKDEIIQRFRGSGIGRPPFVAIHVRRGDYVDNPFYVDLTKTDYYEKAMDLFPKAKIRAGINFLVFSDDIEWCKQQEIFKDCAFSSGRTDIEDFNFMMCCQGHIIANSSYSWWAAYLSPWDGRVVAPKDWHPDGVVRTVLPAGWIQI